MFFNSEKNFFFISLIIISFSLSLLLTLAFHLPSFLPHFLSGLYHTAECRVKRTDTGPILSALKFWFYHCIHCTAYLKRSIRLQGQEGGRCGLQLPYLMHQTFLKWEFTLIQHCACMQMPPFSALTVNCKSEKHKTYATDSVSTICLCCSEVAVQVAGWKQVADTPKTVNA